MKHDALICLALLASVFACPAAPIHGAQTSPAGATISYQLPVVGPGPTNWRVTLAVVDPANPDWIISQFANGVVRTATAENQGKFTETWDGLDDNFMPVPPGRYAVKGIYMPATRWQVDGEFHSITPRFVTGASSWMPSPDQWDKREPFGGDPVGQPLGAVAVGPKGIGVFYYVYLENGLNCPLIDLNKPTGYEQFVRAFNSGGAAGGEAVATDGESVWAYSTDGGPKFVYRADQKPFGANAGANRKNVYQPDGWVTALSAWRDPAANKVFQLDRAGKLLLTYGHLDVQKPESYDPLTLMSPAKLATWVDHNGNDRLIIVEQAGPNRAAEWSADGKLLRDFLSLQTRANDGYAIDPQDPQHIYIAGHRGWLTRFKVDLQERTWTVDAVWPEVGTDPLAPGLDHPQFIRVNGREYLACGKSNTIYRHEGDRWILSAAIIRERHASKTDYFLWNDVRGDGHVREADYQKNPLTLPGNVIRYHGNQWLDDLSLVAINQGGRDVWRLAPEEFDSHGNPIFKEWKRLLTDPIFEARAAGTADATHGGNELAEVFSSDWAMVDGSMNEGFYVNARGGPNFSANEGSQVKISRYVPDEKGGYRLKWRTGREAMQRLAQPGEIYGAMHLRRPINGLLSVIDQSRCGVLLFTEDGLYVDTVFLDGRRFSPAVAGVYPLPGEFFAGSIVPNQQTGKIYFAMGKYTPMLYEAEGWSLKDNPVKPLATVQKTVEISAAAIAKPPEIALSVRGGAGAAHVARFAPALGGVALDGSLAGWESCEPVIFSADKEHTVEVRCLYDPDHLYLRWHARLGAAFSPKALQPADRIFTHDRLADTLSFYFQSDLEAKPNGPSEARPGDVRIVFGIFDDNGKTIPVALGMYPRYTGQAKPSPLTYATPTGKASFEHVGLLTDSKLGYRVDDDGNGFVIAAALARSEIPVVAPFKGDTNTMANFSGTFAGHNRFWWANRDGSASRESYDEPTEARLYPGSWAPAQFQGLDDGVVIRNWLVCGPFGGPGAEQFRPDPRDKMKDAIRAFCDSAHYPPDDGKVDLAAVYKGDDLRGYWHAPAQIRWKPESIAELDTRVILGPSAQTWYGATWIYAPQDTELEFRFQLHPQTFLRFFLNGKLVQSGEVNAAKGQRVPVAQKSLTLVKGWNQIMFHGYCVGYPPFRAGLVLTGPPEKLWPLKITATPPQAP
jgi:hypothetical protein